MKEAVFAIIGVFAFSIVVNAYGSDLVPWAPFIGVIIPVGIIFWKLIDVLDKKMPNKTATHTGIRWITALLLTLVFSCVAVVGIALVLGLRNQVAGG